MVILKHSLFYRLKNFEDFLELASSGDPSKVDIYSNDVVLGDCSGNGEEIICVRNAEMKHSTAFFNFGKAAGAKRGWWARNCGALANQLYEIIPMVNQT